eukprot:s753_g9.t1
MDGAEKDEFDGLHSKVKTRKKMAKVSHWKKLYNEKCQEEEAAQLGHIFLCLFFMSSNNMVMWQFHKLRQETKEEAKAKAEEKEEANKQRSNVLVTPTVYENLVWFRECFSRTLLMALQKAWLLNNLFQCQQNQSHLKDSWTRTKQQLRTSKRNLQVPTHLTLSLLNLYLLKGNLMQLLHFKKKAMVMCSMHMEKLEVVV